jgi:hypothetical protein
MQKIKPEEVVEILDGLKETLLNSEIEEFNANATFDYEDGPDLQDEVIKRHVPTGWANVTINLRYKPMGTGRIL